MATTKVVSINDGPRITVNDLIGNPMWVPTKLKEKMQNIFISEALLRNAGPNPSGLVGYHEGHPTFLTGDVEDIAEGGVIPIAIGERGIPQVALASKRGLGVRVTLEMIRENRVGAVQDQITQLRNTFQRADDRVIRALLQSPAVPTMPVADAWDTTDGNPRLDLALAKREIVKAAPPASAGGSDDEWYGFKPDTIVISGALLPVLLDNEKFLKVYQGNVADQSIAYTGATPQRIFGMDVIESETFPDDKILMLERGTVGFYSDTWPLEFTGLYPEGNGPLGGPTQTYRCDVTHKRAVALDQPKAALWLTDVLT